MSGFDSHALRHFTKGLIVFNGFFLFLQIIQKNKDDHGKNFSFVMNENGEWKLAPAYDLTPSEVINGEYIALVNGKGANITDDDFKVVAERFGIKKG